MERRLMLRLYPSILAELVILAYILLYPLRRDLLISLRHLDYVALLSAMVLFFYIDPPEYVYLNPLVFLSLLAFYDELYAGYLALLFVDFYSLRTFYFPLAGYLVVGFFVVLPLVEFIYPELDDKLVIGIGLLVGYIGMYSRGLAMVLALMVISYLRSQHLFYG